MSAGECPRKPASTGRERYLLPGHELFHGYPSPEEEPRAVLGEIAFCKVFHLELLDILDEPSGKHMVVPGDVKCRTWNGGGRKLTQCLIVSFGLASRAWGWACQPHR